MTKEYWLNEIDKAGTDAIMVNNIVLAAGRDVDFHKDEEGSKQYGEIMNKGVDVIMRNASPMELMQIHDDNLYAAKIALASMLLKLVGIDADLFGDEEDKDNADCDE